jgi:phenylpyruvate tautomerase PptA (4-oxalocrotonate tautomerase family)
MMTNEEHTQHTRKLIAELLDLVCDLLSTDPSFTDPVREYNELRNAAILLGWRTGKVIPLEEH